MTYPISIQLWSVRDDAKQDLRGVLRRLADIGYAGVEPAGFHDLSAAEFGSFVKDLGMQVTGSHSPWTTPDNIQEAVDIAGELGLDMVASGFGREAFADMDSVRRTADTINTVTSALKPHGLGLYLHNHAWEFEAFEGKLGHHWIAELCPDVLFEIDTYWAANFGANNPAEQVAHFAKRAPLLHIKDGTLEKGTANLAVGSGAMDMPAVVAAADPSVLRALIVEFDNCDTDIWEAVEQSYKYLVDSGLGHGAS